MGGAIPHLDLFSEMVRQMLPKHLKTVALHLLEISTLLFLSMIPFIIVIEFDFLFISAVLYSCINYNKKINISILSRH